MGNSSQYYQNTREEMLDFLPSRIGKCIEFGCSQGLFSRQIKEKYQAECWGVDLDEASVAVAGNSLYKVIAGDAFSVISFLPEDYFDCLVCNDFLEHLPDPGLFLQRVRIAMKKDAYLVASLPNVRSWSNVLEFLVFKDWRYKDSGILDKTHLRFFTRKSLIRFIQENNMEIEMFKGTRPTGSILFILADIISLGFIHDMRYSGLAVRAVFK
jgi:2-polyprenyl-3-methyl-5-hydroxy-6-metoxy-1,4-benzoquinol methylase